jgi:ABC-type transporter MlaC component
MTAGRWLTPWALAAMVASTLTARADDGGTAVRSFVERGNARLETALALTDAPQRESAVQAIFRDMVDFDEMTQRTFDGAGLTAKQLAEVHGLMRRALERRTVHILAGTSHDVALAYEHERATAPHEYRVQVEVQSKTDHRAPSLRVDYVVLERDGAYRVVDLVTEGASLTQDYRREVTAMLAPPAGGYARVVKALRASATRVAER